MPGLSLFTGPIPANPGELWCTACAMLYKAEGTAALEDQTATVPDGQVRMFDLARLPASVPRTRMQLAVAFGVFQPGAPPPMGQGFLPLPVPLCWSHMMGLNMKTGLLPAQAHDMPRGGALLLPPHV